MTGPPWDRPAAAVASGLAVTAASAVVLGDYPLSGAVPWITPILVPLLIGAAMTLIDRLHAPGLWMLTGPLAALGVLWGRASRHRMGSRPVADVMVGARSCRTAVAPGLGWDHPPSGPPIRGL